MEAKGSLFVNNKKTAENQPDYTGTIEINGVRHRMAAWKKVGKEKGTKFLSVNISEFRDQGGFNSNASNRPVDPFQIPRDAPVASDAQSVADPF